MRYKVDYSLYLCTDRRLMSAQTVEESVELALKGGCTVVQLREKDLSTRMFYQTALRVKAVTRRFQVPLIVNDRVDIALAAGADGVHVGQSDLPAPIVREIIGKDKLLGVSASSLEEAIQAQKDGADYIGVGAMYPTATKPDAADVTLAQLQEIRQAVSIPIVVIGGINQKTAPAFQGMGIDGLAVVSAVVAQKDITHAASAMRALYRR